MSKMSAHFPRITKHDLEVVVEAMDKLREALTVEEEAKPRSRTDLQASFVNSEQRCWTCDEMRMSNLHWNLMIL